MNLINGSIPQPFVDPLKGVNIPALCEALELDRTQLAKASGASKQSIAHYFKLPRYVKPRKDDLSEFIGKLLRFHALLTAAIGKEASKEDVREWMHSPNVALEFKRPVDLICEKQIGILIKKLEDILFSAQGA